MAQRKARPDLALTPIGERIVTFMQANYVEDAEEFAEGVLGVPYDTFMGWLYDPGVTAANLPVGPMLICAEALTTNAEYLTNMSDDPRPGVALTYDEYVVLQALRDIGVGPRRDDLIRHALEVAAEEGTSSPTANSPYPRAGKRRSPPANEA